MTTSSSNSAVLIYALTKVCGEQAVIDFVKKHHFDVAECYLNATEIANPGELVSAIDDAKEDLDSKFQNGIFIATIFDYHSQIEKPYIFYQGSRNLLFQPKFTINMSHASNSLAIRVEEILEAISNIEPENDEAELVMVGGASSSFATCVQYRKLNKPVIMTTEKDLEGFRNNIADSLVYDARPSTLRPVPITFDLMEVSSDGDVPVKGLRQTIADVAGHEINVTKLGLESAAQEIVRCIREAADE